MNVYLDASVLVPLFAVDPFTVQAAAYLRRAVPTVVVSDFAAAEFSSVLARRVRTGELTANEARTAFTTFDQWLGSVQRISLESRDLICGQAFLRRLDLPLRAPDALHIAIAQRIGVELATFDAKMARCAQALDVAITPI